MSPFHGVTANWKNYSTARHQHLSLLSDCTWLVSGHVTGLRVETSVNVVAEDLHNTRNLETTYYVTDMTQASDFYWERESGIRVNIGILDVHLIPEYEDVDHESDNKYMLSNPNNSEDKAKFQNILRNFCRWEVSFRLYLKSWFYRWLVIVK